MFKHIKSVAILLLIAAALFQTGQLWFVNITNRNFFYTSLFTLINAGTITEQSPLTSPYRIITYLGDNRFDVRYSGLQQADEKKYGDSLITAILRSGEFTGVTPMDYDSLYKSPALVYQYAFNMPADVFALGFAQKGTVLTGRGLAQFNTIVLCPPVDETDGARVIFVDGEQAYTFVLSQNNKLDPSAQYAYAFPTTNSDMYYAWQDGLFVPYWDDGAAYAAVTITNPYTNVYGEKLMLTIQDKVAHFFDNPATVNAGPGAGGVFTYNGANTVVRYFDRDIVEYVSYKSPDMSVQPNILTDYATALAFIARDPNVKNEYYLAGYKTEDARHTFYFDYVINNLPLVMPNGWPTQAENGHPIEITVERETVVRYKKLAYVFRIDEQTTASLKMDTAGVPEAYKTSGLFAVWPAYKMDTTSPLSLGWFIHTDGEWHMVF